MKDAFKELILEFHAMKLPSLIERHINIPSLPVGVKKAIIFIGMRRSGKTWAMYQLMSRLIEQGVPTSCILYVNFEDDRLDGLLAKDFQSLLDAYYELYPDTIDNKDIYFFLDEIQVVNGWEKFIRRLIDTDKMKLTLSGSSAKLLSIEIATSLRGRTIDREIFPMSFSEYCHHKNVPLTSTLTSKQRAVAQHHYNHYFTRGGFPETLEADDFLSKELIQGYVDSVLYKDIIERHNITNVLALKKLLNHCLKNAAAPLSINKLYNSFKSQGIAVSRSTLYDFMDYLEDAYCIFSVALYHFSTAKSSNQPKKIYPIDPGMISAYTIKPEFEKAAMLETSVFIQLRRHHKEIYYYHTPSGKEIDFVVVAKDNVPALYQVSLSLKDAATRKREVDALVEAMQTLKLTNGTIVTLDETETIETDAGVIQCFPAWQLL